MKIEIEIGNDEEKKARKKEIIYFLSLIGIKIIKKLNIKKIIVSSDVSKTVNKLRNTDNYKSVRYMVECQATIIIGKNNERYIVFSSFWNNCLDQNLRFFFFSHEIHHLLDDLFLPKIKNDCTAKSQYLGILRQMYSEYSANRFAIELFKKPLNEIVRNCFEILYDGFFNPLQNPNNFYNPLKIEIIRFRFSSNIDEFLKRSLVIIEPAYTYLSYIFAYRDSLDFIAKKFNEANKDLFINECTYELFNEFKIWYESNKKINFEDGLEEIQKFLPFLSLSFQDVTEGLYVEVLDI